MSRIRVAVIGGGQNCEHEVSLASAESVAGALDPLAYDVVRLTIGPDGGWRDATGELIGLAESVTVLQGCAVALPVVHGPRGEDGTLAALLELAGVPYAGSGVRAGALGMDKWATKLVAEASGIDTAPGDLVRAGASLAYAWKGPVVVKPVAAGSSQGVTLVGDERELTGAFERAFAIDDRVLVEQVVVGREVDVAVLATADGDRLVSPPLEIVSPGFFDYAAKYGGGAQFQVPAVLSAAEGKALEHAALTMFDALGCRGVARIDFFLTAAGPVLNEVNTMPGFTAQSQVPRMFAAAGLPYAGLLDLLIRTALPAER